MNRVPCFTAIIIHSRVLHVYTIPFCFAQIGRILNRAKDGIDTKQSEFHKLSTTSRNIYDIPEHLRDAKYVPTDVTFSNIVSCNMNAFYSFDCFMVYISK